MLHLRGRHNQVVDAIQVAGVEEIVADVLEGRAVDLVPAGGGDHVYNAAGGAAELRLGIVADDHELLDQIDIGNDNVCRSSDIGVNDAVEEIQLRPVLLPVEGRIRETGAGNANISFTSADSAILGCRDRRHTWSQRQ